MSRGRDRQSSATDSSQSFSQSFAPFEPSQPFPPLVEDPEPLHESESAGDTSGGIVGDDEDDDEEEGDGDNGWKIDDEPDGGIDFHSHVSSLSPSASESDDEDSDNDNDNGNGNGNGIGLHAPFFRSTSTGSLPGPNAFAPPFYNRPPTPLPPSPSLTSLLRPSFSATTSRPTTPDSSDAETPNDTEAAVEKSARNATTVPRASPKVPTYEYYGFVLYLASSLAFLIYLLWSFLPSPFLHQLGIYYYPNRWWSLAIPAYLVMTIVYIYIALAAYNTGYLTLPMSSIENLVDETANIAVVDSKGRRRPGGSQKINPDAATAQTVGGAVQKRKLDWRNVWNEGTDAVMDIPVGGVCEVLYGYDDDGRDEAHQFPAYRRSSPFSRHWGDMH